MCKKLFILLCIPVLLLAGCKSGTTPVAKQASSDSEPVLELLQGTEVSGIAADMTNSSETSRPNAASYSSHMSSVSAQKNTSSNNILPKSSSSAKSSSASVKPPKQEITTSFHQKPVSSVQSKPIATSSTPSPPTEKNPYAYPFDIEAVKRDLIAYGESLGMKHRTATEEPYFDADRGQIIPVGIPITPQNSSWWGGYILTKTVYPNPGHDKQQLYDYVKHDWKKFELTQFTIYAEQLSEGAYQIYVLR